MGQKRKISWDSTPNARYLPNVMLSDLLLIAFTLKENSD